MAATAEVRARIDEELKSKANEALSQMGLSMSEAIRLMLVRVAEEGRLPFEVRVPNAATLEAVRELESGGGTRIKSLSELDL